MDKKLAINKEKLVSFLKKQKRAMRPGQIARYFKLNQEEKKDLIFLLEELEKEGLIPSKVIKENRTRATSINAENILNCLANRKKNCNIKDIYCSLNINNEQSQKELAELLKQLVLEGKVLECKNGYCIFPQNSNLLVGPLHINNAGDGHVNNIFIDKNNLFGANNGDIVLIEIIREFLAEEKGIIRRVLKRSDSYLPYTFENGQLIPYGSLFEYKIYCDPKLFEGLENGDRVGIKLSPSPYNNAFQVEELTLIAKKDDPSLEYKSIAVQNGFDYSYTKEELDQVEEMATSITKKELIGRKDFRSEQSITIDGAKTKDMDDAIYCRKLPNGQYEVNVHILDVGHYIKKGSPLYLRALRNTSSLYLMNVVFHMLHSKISNGICSLNEGVDRLTLSTTIILGSEGEIVSYDFNLGVINSKKKATYEDVNDYLDKGILIEGYEPFKDLIDTAKEISDKLDVRRQKNGCIEFASNEPDFNVDPNGKITDIKNSSLGSAEKIIENLMLLPDYCFADYMNWMGISYIKRIHECPDDKKIKEVVNFINTLGFKTNHIRNTHDPMSLKKIMDQIKDIQEFPILSDILLRSMKRARYSLDNVGHYGLAVKYHTHVTAPIRRVVDLENHYILREILLNENKNIFTKYELDYAEKELRKIATQASTFEISGELAEKDAQKMEMAALMESKIGQYFNGRITNIAPYGINVKTEKGIIGFVRFENVLDGNYRFDLETLSLSNKKGITVKISDPVRLKLLSASKEQRTIYFRISQLIEKSKVLNLTNQKKK